MFPRVLATMRIFVLVLASSMLGESLFTIAFAFPTTPSNPRGSMSLWNSPIRQPSFRRRVPVMHSTTSNTTITDTSVSSSNPIDHDDDEDLDVLLEQVTQQQLINWCQQFQLDTVGSKTDLLQRLRSYAQQQVQLEQQRLQQRIQRVEERYNENQDHHSKERYEILSDRIPDADDEDDDEAYFYVPLPTTTSPESRCSTDEVTKSSPPKPTTKSPRSSPSYLSNAVITAPPPPDHVNENGERVVTIYSSSEHNDLTGIAASQPGQTNLDSLSASASTSSIEPWEQSQQSSSSTTQQEIDEAKEVVTDLVQHLLAMTGAPAYAGIDNDEDDDDNNETPNDVTSRRFIPRSSKTATPTEFVGFQPSQVSTSLLVQCSKALRTNRGQVLHDTLRQYELQAIGYDGMAGDNAEKGGGHYREVSKIRAFLEGYRRAEVKRLARETAALLLDKLVQEGVQGLDVTLSSMTRSGDETSDHAGELNDSLLDYLNDAIRQQERKVESSLIAEKPTTKSVMHESEDPISSLWSVETEEGHRVESINPNDPQVKKVLLEEYAKSQQDGVGGSSRVQYEPQPNAGASEQLLMLLKLLRQRIEAEAAFAPDEKGRNLRLLAYCLQVSSNQECEQLILKDTGNSLDRLDSFMELVASSIEYGESTSHQLQPSKTKPLNVRRLRAILDLSNHLRQQIITSSRQRP